MFGLLLALGGMVLSGRAGWAQSADAVRPASVRADLDTLLRTFEAVHPDLYRNASREDIRRRRAVIEQQLTGPVSPRTVAVAMARLAAAFDDGHTRVDLPLGAYEAAARSGARTFPLTVSTTNGRVYVRRSCDSALPPRARLLSINGRDAAVLFQTVQAVVSGAEPYRQAVAEDQFPWLLWLHEVEAPFRIAYVSPSTGAPQTRTLRGADFATVQRCLSPDPQPAYTFSRRARTALLTIHRLAHPARFRQFLGTVADSLEQQPPDGLVIDLRDCPGGRTRVARLLLSAFTDEPLRLVARKDWKVSTAYKQHLRTRLPGHPYLDRPVGRVVSIRYDAKPLPSVPLRYRGPLTVLVGPRTFSSAVTLAATLKANQLATVVGSETGGRVHRFGEGYTFRLPHTGLHAMVSSAYFAHASRPRDWSGGVPPHVPVQPPVGVGSDITLGVALARMRHLDAVP